MGGFLPTVAMTALQMGLNVAQQTREAREMNAERKAAAEGQVAQLRQAQEVEDRERRERLRRALAAQKARFGAQSLGMSGSAGAVLSGLAAEAAREDAESRALTDARIQRIGGQVRWANRRSLLEASMPPYRMAFDVIHRSARNVSLLDG